MSSLHKIILVAGALFCLTALPVLAQTDDKSKSSNSKSGSSETQIPNAVNIEALYISAFDIPRLRALNQMNLTDSQLDELVVLVSETQKAYLKKQKEMNTAIFSKLEKNLKKSKADGLLGKPTDYDEETRKAVERYPQQTAALDQQFAELYVTKLKDILKKDQITAAAQFAKSEQKKISPDAKGTDSQWFNFYVNGIFAYPRILPLLQEMQAARKAPKEKEDIPPPPK